jgi:hypothetical protein
MNDEKLREIVADAVARTHGNKDFIRRIREGDQDDGPYMVSAFAVREWYQENMAFVTPAPENVEE